MYLNDEFLKRMPHGRRRGRLEKSRFSIQVIYEDADIAALYKPAHLLCHSDRTGDDSLRHLKKAINQFIRYLKKKKACGNHRAHACAHLALGARCCGH